GLALAIVPLSAAAGGGCHPKSNDPSSSDATGSTSAAVPIEGCQFSPTVLYVDPGTEVTWTNEDPAPHTVTGPLHAWGSDSELLLGDKIAYRFEEEGVYPYACIFHPGMNGAIVVGDGVGEMTAAAVTSVDADPPQDGPKTQPEGSGGIDTNDALLLSGGVAAIVGAVGFGAGLARRRAGAVG
ncbi:MAG: cupredoxin domain-containing protein, partial [Actinomycetota bacterium]